MFINLSHLFNSIFLFSDYQSERSCVRWTCVAPFSSVHVTSAAFVHALRAGSAVAQEGMIESKGIEPQRSRPRRLVRGFTVVESALLRYKEMHGDMLVPQSFIVPSNDESWPEETWGMRLGKTVSQIRAGAGYNDRRAELTIIGFDYSLRVLRYGYAAVRLALLQYKEMHGDMLVPQSFVIPGNDESWPEETWGMRLGETVGGIRSGNSCKDKREDLVSIGFDYSPQVVRYGYAAVRSALLRYKKMHGDMLVTRSFIIPSEDKSWLKETWGMKLGKTVDSIRRGKSYKVKQEELISIGFNYSQLVVRYGYALIRSALLQYKEMHGDMLVPQSFVVPSKSWPEETWGMRLGASVMSIRSGNSLKVKREELISIGFDYSSQSAAYGYDAIRSALLRYKERHGDMRVPVAFIIPRGDKLWPEETRGMKLGKTVDNIRRGASYKDKQEELISIGFVFKA